ncbi:hypothetical protein HPB47_020242 [Ixodes persulcatus]|uniref:Uncharacterized protein n=1 Tax=Ixodes persulcatus TaxID=34615 RepID=A0AC60QG17_IXOPE|nr:hypothetical protein HPB47_020242 [Ixodes persulcatus]
MHQSRDSYEFFVLPQPKLYRSVIEDVINGVKDIFLDEGVDDQALQELRQPLHIKLTIGSNGIVQPTVLQYHSTTTAGGKFTITLPAQTQHGMQTVMSTPAQAAALALHPDVAASLLQGGMLSMTQAGAIQAAQRGTILWISLLSEGKLCPDFASTPAQAAALALHPDVAASLLQGGMLSMTQAGAIQAAQRAAAGGMGNAGAVGGLQFHQVMKPMGDQQQHQYTVVTTGGQPVVTTTASPSTVTTVLAPPPSTTTSQPNQVIQLDGANDTSDEEEEEDEFQDNEEDKEDNDDDQADEDNEDEGDEEVEPLNSDDDVSDEEATENFEIDNVVVCQYDKISRSRNRWKFHFKDGIMNLQGKDYVFQKAVGDAEW